MIKNRMFLEKAKAKIKSILLIGVVFAVSGLFFACSEDREENNAGYLRLSLETESLVEVISRSTTDIPDIYDFSVQINKADGTPYRHYETYGEIKEDAISLPVGGYQIIASYGDTTAEGYGAGAYEGSVNTTITEGNTSTVQVVCALAQSRVTVEYSDVFKGYFSDFTVTLKSASGTSYSIQKNQEVAPLYLRPGQVNVQVALTKQNGVSSTYQETISNTQANKHYVVKLDVNGGEAGKETLAITFSDEVEDKSYSIDISDEAMLSAAPFFTPTGFVSGEVITIKEGNNAGELSLLLTARGKIKSCIIDIESDYLTSVGVGWPASVDLVGIAGYDATPLTNYGFEWTGVAVNSQMAILDFTKVLPYLQGDGKEHTFTIRATDQNSKVSEELVVLRIRTETPNFVLATPDPVKIESTEVTFSVELDEGMKADLVAIQYKDGYGVWHTCNTVKAELVSGYKYDITSEIAVGTSDWTIRAIYNSVLQSNEITLAVAPDFTLSIENISDIWSNKVKLKINPTNPESLNNIEANLIMYALPIGGIYEEVASSVSNGYVTVVDLKPGIRYAFKGVSDGEYYSREITGITTESALTLPNGNFENGWEEFYNNNIKQGGRYGRRGITGGTPSTWYQHDFDLVAYSLTGWSTVNSKTVPIEASNENTWYIVPSSQPVEDNFDGNYAIKLTNVAWDSDGPAIVDFSNSYSNGVPAYCANEPSSIANRSAGKLFLGDYSYDHDTNEEIYNEGVEFTSRPLGLSGYYKYTDQESDEGGTVSITVEHREGDVVTILAQKDAVLTAVDEYTLFKVDLDYVVTDKKATHLKVMFTSSTKSSYDQAVESANITTLNRNSATESVSTGSELYLDNIELIYE